VPDKETLDRAREDAREGKSTSTQAGEFVREEIHHVREGKHGAASAKQAIAIGLSKARKAGVNLPPAPKGSQSAKKQGSSQRKTSGETSSTRSRATSAALKRKGHSAGSRTALSRQARGAAKKRSSASRSAAARKAARTRSRAA
jgi:hypothetical protein